jgi:hypothetical protein
MLSLHCILKWSGRRSKFKQETQRSQTMLVNFVTMQKLESSWRNQTCLCGLLIVIKYGINIKSDIILMEIILNINKLNLGHI